MNAAIRFQEPDRVPIDLGGTWYSGVHASTYARLKEFLGISGGSCRVIDVGQMLAEVELPVVERLRCDVVALNSLESQYGIRNADWKRWRFWDGTDMEVPGAFNVIQDESGDSLLVLGGQGSQPVARMPKNGYYFDCIEPESFYGEMPKPDPEDVRKCWPVFTNEELEELRTRAKFLYEETDYALVGGFGRGGMYGVGGMTGWFVTMLEDPQYVHDIHGLEMEIALENLRLYLDAVGDYISVIVTVSYDFGTQKGEIMSPDCLREFYAPYHKSLNDYVHSHSDIKTFCHSCGSIYNIIDDLIDAGVDILNPVQCSALNMEPERLKEKFGGRIVFWGGGIDTQHTLPFGTPDEVRRQAEERVLTFAPGGGFIFTTVHNIQCNTPCENIVAAYETAAGISLQIR